MKCILSCGHEYETEWEPSGKAFCGVCNAYVNMTPPPAKQEAPELSALRILCTVANEVATANGFTDATVGEEFALMHSEISEALEDFRAGHALDETWYETKENGARKPCGIPSEMADVVLCVAHFCGKHKLDLAKAVSQKIAYNRTRGFMHGGKKL